MKEQTKRISEDKKEKKKDYYTVVMIFQIISAAILFVLFTLFVKPSQSVKDEFLSLICENRFDVYSSVSALKEYFSSDNSWAVFGDSVVLAPSETTAVYSAESYEPTSDTAVSDGTGGDDLEIYEAASNTSFAVVKTTSPAVAPIENGRYTSYFGYRINPITGKFSFHTGLDIAAVEGTKIRAAFSGKVTKVGEDSRAGKYIFLTHDDGFVTFYCHCSEISAEEGAVIRQGETIARVGSTGWSTGPHLHFEIRKNNIRYNPIYILENDC